MLQKMMRLTVFLLFLSCVFCLATGQTQTSYSEMEPDLKRFVDLALNKANQQFHGIGHLNFLSIGDGAQLTTPVRIDVRLKNTVCRKVPGTQHTHRPECAFKRINIRCWVCSSDPNTSDPFIDCVRNAEQKTRYAVWDQNCPITAVLLLSGQHVLNKGYGDDE